MEYKTLSEVVRNFLNTRNTDVFCRCGNRQAHNLVYCRKCGRKFSDGYTPKTQGDKIRWLIDKPGRDMIDPPSYEGAVILSRCRRQTGDKDITTRDVTREIKRQLNIE